MDSFYQKRRDDMPSTTTFKTRLHWEPNFTQGLHRTIQSSNPTPTRFLDRGEYSYARIPPPASRAEIYGLAIGTCFLALLLAWLLLLGIRNAINFFANKSNRVTRERDPESNIIFEARDPEERRPFLSNVRNVSAGQFIASARRKSVDFATGVARGIGGLRRTTHPTPYVDEEAALGETENNGTDTNGPFLRHNARHMAGALPV
ncbi:uncharacterized protein F4822DRAFT_369719 [Hypoxylon trugodes]|uniref:uncharacterized protein n=1 Tax=Hypoxylon trugodes TaxID=326681 RepID=UPI002190E536|nr:uncharacterized protein F4822DRAFT_369719 [Hypoxylon trugodes]KAI1384670.1 hypothetical protein F4822DRAFT_369719 [Hypoxylon trugodes]